MYENPNLTYDERMNNYQGPIEVQTNFKSNDFKFYQNSVGVGNNNVDLNTTVNSIQERIARA